ncbi:MAG: Exonuclease SbcC, partial [Labilithrix sp.]|nr:Exonuclease SbcC [Labilithrix sp.]
MSASGTNGSGHGAGTGLGEGAGHRSLPPDAPLPLRVRSMTFASPPLARRAGRVAEEAQLRARLELARILGDPVEEQTFGRELAERLAARDVEMDAAVELAFRTLAAADDPELRHALVGWLEGLGEHGLAASELRKLPRPESAARAAAVLLRIALLHARSGDDYGAQEALGEAAELDPSDALPLELLGALGAGNPDDAAAARTRADAYVHAARRRAAAGDASAESEDLLRAFEIDPTSPLATAALVAALQGEDRASAADEVLRAHAVALGKVDAAQALEVHARRRAAALETGDVARALAAALDEGLDASTEEPGRTAFEDLLARSSAFEPLAVHLELRAERAEGQAEAARHWAELGRLLSGPLASPERAVAAYARSVAADPTNADALHALRAQTASSVWLVEALVRAALGDAAYGATTDRAARLAAARALADHAEGSGDAPLGHWASELVGMLDRDDEHARSLAARFEDGARAHERTIREAFAALEGASGPDREDALTTLVRLLRSTPARSRELAVVLVELALLRADASDDGGATVAEALRVAERVCDFDAVKRLCAQRSSGDVTLRERLGMTAALRRAGDLSAASRLASRGLAGGTPWAAAVAWITAAAAHDEAAHGLALAAVAPSFPRATAAALATVASERLRAFDVAASRRAAEQACREGEGDARALRALAASLSGDGAELPHDSRHMAITALDRAASVAGPTPALCMHLSRLLEEAGGAAAALAWA